MKGCLTSQFTSAGQISSKQLERRRRETQILTPERHIVCKVFPLILAFQVADEPIETRTFVQPCKTFLYAAVVSLVSLHVNFLLPRRPWNLKPLTHGTGRVGLVGECVVRWNFLFVSASIRCRYTVTCPQEKVLTAEVLSRFLVLRKTEAPKDTCNETALLFKRYWVCCRERLRWEWFNIFK